MPNGDPYYDIARADECESCGFVPAESGAVEFGSGMLTASAYNALASFVFLTSSDGSIGIDFDAETSTYSIVVVPSHIDHTKISNIGQHSHDEIDAHIINVDNPHAVTSTQVGCTEALWNASKIQGYDVSNNVPTVGQALVWDEDAAAWVPGDVATGPSDITVVESTSWISPSLIVNAVNGNVDWTTVDLTGIVTTDAISLYLQARVTSKDATGAVITVRSSAGGQVYRLIEGKLVGGVNTEQAAFPLETTSIDYKVTGTFDAYQIEVIGYVTRIVGTAAHQNLTGLTFVPNDAKSSKFYKVGGYGTGNDSHFKEMDPAIKNPSGNTAIDYWANHVNITSQLTTVSVPDNATHVMIRAIVESTLNGDDEAVMYIGNYNSTLGPAYNNSMFTVANKISGTVASQFVVASGTDKVFAMSINGATGQRRQDAISVVVPINTTDTKHFTWMLGLRNIANLSSFDINVFVEGYFIAESVVLVEASSQSALDPNLPLFNANKIFNTPVCDVAPSDGDILRYSDGCWHPGTLPPAISYIQVVDSQAPGAAPQPLVKDVWLPRRFSLIRANSNNLAVSLVSGTSNGFTYTFGVTIPAGTYMIYGAAPTRCIDTDALSVLRVSASDGQIIDGIAYRGDGDDDNGITPTVNGMLIFSSQVTIQLQHYTSRSIRGLGEPATLDGVQPVINPATLPIRNEIYATLDLTKIA